MSRDTDHDVFARSIALLRERAAGEREGICGPQSLSWQILREVCILFGGGRALILQLAHPAVAAGVEAHSTFRKDPLGRARRTFSNMYGIVFGDLTSALRNAQRIHGIHNRVKGHVQNDTQTPAAGRPYRANDPALLFWVMTTLMDSSHQMFELLVRPLSRDEKAQSYEETKLTGLAMGIPDGFMPRDWEHYEAYLRDMIEGDTLAFGETGRALMKALFRATFGADRLITAGLLPERIRRDLQISFSEKDEQRHRKLLSILREIIAEAPAAVRYVPAYHQALARLANDRKKELSLTTRLVDRIGQRFPLPLGLAARPSPIHAQMA